MKYEIVIMNILEQFVLTDLKRSFYRSRSGQTFILAHTDITIIFIY